MNSTTKAASFQITSPQSPWYPKHTGPSFEGARVINLLSKRGAEGQSRTDTELPPPVFEFDAGRFTL